MKAVILVPRRDGNPARDALWAWTKPRWRADFPDIDIIEGHQDWGFFNRSLAINRAAEQAGDWDVAIIIDSDVIIPAPQVRAGIDLALATNAMVLPFERRREMSEGVTRRMLERGHVPLPTDAYRTFPDNPSSVIIVSRSLWEQTRGFDPSFVGWGCEDNAFHYACRAMSRSPERRLPGDLIHLYHDGAPEGNNSTKTYQANYRRFMEYVHANGNPDRMRRVRDEGKVPNPPTKIPRILHRIVLGEEPAKSAEYWQRFRDLHPEWQLITHTDPLNPDAFPLTSPYWDRAVSVAQVADLVRFEVLLRWGGVYVDWDVEPLRSFDPLLGIGAFSAWEDSRSVAFGVIGAPPEHPAIRATLDEMLHRIDVGQGSMSDDIFIHYIGNGTVTELWPRRDDIFLFAPGVFYPYHYGEKHRSGEDFTKTAPWAYAVHHWWASWTARNLRRGEPARPLIDGPIMRGDPAQPLRRRPRREVVLW